MLALLLVLLPMLLRLSLELLPRVWASEFELAHSPATADFARTTNRRG